MIVNDARPRIALLGLLWLSASLVAHATTTANGSLKYSATISGGMAVTYSTTFTCTGTPTCTGTATVLASASGCATGSSTIVHVPITIVA